MNNNPAQPKKIYSLLKSNSGFTLIELLIVIVIIGILAGVVLSVINPAKQQRKAKEASMRATVEKVCLALHACGSSTVKGGKCDSYTDIGVTVPLSPVVPTGAVYYLVDTLGTSGDTSTNLTSISSNNVDDYSGATDHTGSIISFVGDLTASGSEKTCRFLCGYDFGTATPIALHEAVVEGGATTTFGCLVD